MDVIDVKMTLLPDNGQHTRLAFCDVVLGNDSPAVVLRPFVVRRLRSRLGVEWPGKRDKKQPAGRYLFVQIVDEELADAIQKEVLRKYEAMRLLAKVPAAPGRSKGWHRVSKPKRQSRVKR